MTKSATDVMQEILVAATLDSIEALKAASKGVPNTLLRDLNAIHSNTTFADLPRELQAALVASVRAGFTRLMREGYSVTAGQAAPPHTPPPRRDSDPRGRPGRPPRPSGPNAGAPRPGGPNAGAPRPGGKPRHGGRPGGGKPRPPRG
jgi:hypothetical protein